MTHPEGSYTCLLIGLLISLPALFLVAYPTRSRVASWLSSAQPEARSEALDALFGPGQPTPSSPAGPAGGGIIRY